jgi:predicted nucleotidyltransferase
MTASESTFAPLRRRERQRRIAALRQRLRDTLGPNDCSVWVYSCGEAFGYGSLARGDWDGFSDIDLLVVAANQDAAERVADQLTEALVGDDVLAIDHERWQDMAISPSPHWLAIRAQAIRLHQEP